jgi:hypothetical protein
VQGRINFLGSWPADTDFVAVALFPYEPTSDDPVLPVAWQTIEDLPPGSVYDYSLTVPGGSYGFLVVAWIRQGSNIFDFDSWVLLAVHSDPAEPSLPGEVIVINGIIREIDLTADLNLVPIAVRDLATGPGVR